MPDQALEYDERYPSGQLPARIITMVLQAVGHINLPPCDNDQVIKASVVPFHF